MSAAVPSRGTDPTSGPTGAPAQERALPVRPRPRVRDRDVLIPLGLFLVFVVLIALLLNGLLLPVGTTSVPAGNRPIGTALAFGDVHPGNCTVLLVNGQECVAVGDLVYDVFVAASTATYGSFRLEVELGSGVLKNTGTGEFSVAEGGYMTAKSVVYPGAGLAMTGGWATYASGTSASTNLTTDCSIFIDVGQSWAQTPSNLTLTAIGQASYAGTTTSVALAR